MAKKLNLKIINVDNLDKKQRKSLGLEYKKDYTPEEFLKLYKNATFVLTDSYHGTCFSVKFNKPFISIINTQRGKLRYKLFDTLHVSERIVPEPDEIYKKEYLLKPFDYTTTNSIIAQKADFAIKWLENALKYKMSASDFRIIELVHRLDDLSLLTRQNQIINKYHYYKFMYKIMWGNKRKKYKSKYKALKPTVRKIRQIIKNMDKDL